MNYTPLYIKTHNSLLSSLIKIDDLIEFAIKNNLKSLTITDNNMFGVIEFYEKCREHNIKPIIGLEIKYCEYDYILYARNYNGYKNLLKIATIASGNKLTIDDLKQYSDNLILICPYFGLKYYEDLRKIYEICFVGYKTIEEYNSIGEYDRIYCNQILCLEKDEYKYLKYLYAIKQGKRYDLVEDDFSNNYLKLEDDLNFDLRNNYKIFDICSIEIKKDSNLLPVYRCPDNLSSEEYLRKLCIDGMKRIFGESVSKVYKDRLKYELDVINKMGFANYFLVVWDYVKFAKNMGILVGPGRGSAAGSLVSYVLNITTIDPIKYNLLFERFLNENRVTMPDIDIDFEFNRRDEVIKYCISKYGEKRVAPIITFGTLASKQAIRDVGKCMDIDLKVIDYICKLIDAKISLQDNLKKTELKKYLNYNQELVDLYKIAMKFEGLKRHTSIHAAGIVISEVELDSVIPLELTHEGFYITGYSMEYLESLGLLKMDFLALRNLTLINDTINNLKSDGYNIEFDTIPENDDLALEVFNKVDTLGIFQFESSGMINFLKKLRPKNFEDVFSAIALFRPGPMNNIDTFIKRKNGIEKIDYLDNSLEQILKPTYGVIIYQEQIMQIARVMASYSLGEADILRRAMSKKKESIILSHKDKFINNSVKNGYTLDTATRVFDIILKFAAYGFNRAHSVAYSLISYRMAYLKSHYPLYFMTELLTMAIGDEKKTKQYINECLKKGINILNPDINKSFNCFKVENNQIRFPLNAIKNIGASISNTIINERKNGLYKDIFDFTTRMIGQGVNKKSIISLTEIGSFDEFGVNRATIINNIDIIINYAEIGGLLQDELKPVLIENPEYDDKELMQKELDNYGFYLSHNPITKYKNKFDYIVDISEIDKYFDKNVNVIICVDKFKKITTKNGDEMGFINGSDEIGTIDFVLFPKIFNEYNDIKINSILKISGHVEKRFDSYQIVVKKMEKLSE